MIPISCFTMVQRFLVGAESEEGEEEEEEEEEVEDEGEEGIDNDGVTAMDEIAGSNAIVLHEDKEYYPDAREVFGEAEAVTLDEDAQPLEEPVIAPVKTKTFSTLEKEAPEQAYSPEFLAVLLENPTLVRNTAFVGHLHAGKTSLLDLLVGETRAKPPNPTTAPPRYTDTRHDEQARGISIKSCPVSMPLSNSSGKHYLINGVDCPGHVNFEDEAVAVMRACDGAVVVVDAVEGVLMQTERAVRAAMVENLSITLIINKVDRLILELKLPPRDAYYKLHHTIEEVNTLLLKYWTGGKDTCPGLSPSKGNVCFASALHGWVFSTESFARVYSAAFGGEVDAKALKRRLWGDWWFDPEKRKFVKSQPCGDYEEEIERSFIAFILNPLYKVYAAVMGEDASTLRACMKELGVKLSALECELDPKPLLRLACGRIFNHVSAVVDMVEKHVPSPLEAAAHKVQHIYTGDVDTAHAQAMIRCDSQGPLMINVVKLYSSADGASFRAFGRVYSGSVRVGQEVRVLGESYSADDDEDMAVQEVLMIGAPGGRFATELSMCKAGNWVILEGIDANVIKTATITDNSDVEWDDVRIFCPLSIPAASTVKLAVEPLNPSELPKMVDGLRSINKSFPQAGTKVEESGEHVIFASGELAMDCILHDLREMYSGIEVKVSDPSCRFCETVVETSSLKCFGETPNKKNKLTIIAEPLDDGLAGDIEAGRVNIDWDRKKLGDFFRKNYDWDLLAARSVWAFGPDEHGPNLILDDTLPSEVDKKLLGSVKSSIVQGFQWGCREGPLCDEPLRNTKFKILDATVASEAIHRGGGQIIPTARRVAYSAFLTATPRLMEPVYSVEIHCPADVVSAVYPVIQKRRGHIVQDAPKAGAPFYTMKAFLPVIDSFGFETDLRCYTQGQAFCLQVFDHWSLVPGDPMDQSIVLHPLEPSPAQHLAREFMVKTRRRKGLSEDVNVENFFDETQLSKLAFVE